MLFSDPQDDPQLRSLRQGLRDLGYVEAQMIVFEYRFAEGRAERLADAAARRVCALCGILFALVLPPGEPEREVVAALRTCYDPEIPVDIYELGLIYGVTAAPEGAVHVRMTLTSPNCLAAQELPADVEQQKVRAVPGVTDARDEIVFDPPWDSCKMSDAARTSARSALTGGNVERMLQAVIGCESRHGVGPGTDRRPARVGAMSVLRPIGDPADPR